MPTVNSSSRQSRDPLNTHPPEPEYPIGSIATCTKKIRPGEVSNFIFRSLQKDVRFLIHNNFGAIICILHAPLPQKECCFLESR